MLYDATILHYDSADDTGNVEYLVITELEVTGELIEEFRRPGCQFIGKNAVSLENKTSLPMEYVLERSR